MSKPLKLGMRLQLYRGISADEFKVLSAKELSQSRRNWKPLLAKRVAKDMSYPTEMDHVVQHLERIARLERQHFTDNAAIAKSYARKVDGVVVAIDVSIHDVIKHFRLEFQNFAKRKKNFEIVYIVDAKIMAKNLRRWKFKTKRF